MNIDRATETIFFCYLCSGISIVGLILSGLSYLVFCNPQFKENLYNYLKFEIACIGFNLLIASLRPLYHCENVTSAGTYGSVLFFIVFLHYLSSVLEMTAIVCHNLSMFDFYLLVSGINNSNLEQSRLRKFIIHRLKKNHRIICFLVLISSMVLFSFQTFEFEIKASSFAQNFTSLASVNGSMKPGMRYNYSKQKSKWCDEKLFIINQKMAFTLRDNINLNVLVLLNTLIFFRLKEVLRNKIQLLDKNGKGGKELDELVKSVRSKMNLILASSLNTFLGRYPIWVYFMMDIYFDWSQLHLLCKFAVLAVDFSYSLNFLLFYFTNNIFKRVTNSFVKKWLNRNERKDTDQ
jgi:hypothetical protein